MKMCLMPVLLALAGMSLEASTLTDTNWVQQMYSDLLTRPASAFEVQIWLDAIGQGGTRTSVAQSVLDSNEYRQDLVSSWYGSYLNRTPSQGEINPQLAAFVRDEFTQSSILGSGEYFGAHGSTNGGFVAAVYTDILHRTALQQEINTGAGLLDANTLSRAQFALSVLDSLEADSDAVAGYFQTFLHRTAGPEGTSFVNILQSNGTHEQVIALIIGSDEYYAGTQTATTAPEPGAMLLCGAGLIALALKLRATAKSPSGSRAVAPPPLH